MRGEQCHYSNLFNHYYYNKGFISFDLPEIPEGYSLDSVNVHIYQFFCESNGFDWTYPIYDMSDGDVEPPCLLDHMDYGYTLDESDFFEPTLQYIGIISDTPEANWRSIDVTNCVFNDIDNDRFLTQYRLSLTIDSDYDYCLDALGFVTAETPTEFEPFIIYNYKQSTNTLNETIDISDQIIFSGYPNAFYEKINFEIKNQVMKI